MNDVYERAPPDDVLLNVRDGAKILGYSHRSLQQMLSTSPKPPPYFKLPNGHWRAWRSELEKWIDDGRDERVS